MVTINIHGKKVYPVNLPERWGDLTPEQFAHIIRLRLLQVEDIKIKFALFWVAAKAVCPERELLKEVSDDQIERKALPVLDFIEKSPCTTVSLFPTFNLWRGLGISIGKAYKGPTDNIGGVSIEQIAVAEIAMNGYSKNWKIDLLNTMVAALYYPDAIKNGLDDKKLDRLKRKISRIPFTTRFTIFAAYRAMRETFPTEWKDLFNGPSAPSNITDVEAWNDLFSSLAKDGPKDIMTNRKVEAGEVFNWLNKHAKDAAKHKK